MKLKKDFFIVSLIILIFSTHIYSQDNATEFGVVDDLTVLGVGGTYDDPDVEIKGFTVFGTTQYVYTANIPYGPGNVIINGVLGVSSGAYVAGISTIAYVSSITVSGAEAIFIKNGNAGQILRKKSTGELEWVDTNIFGDSLGSHIATMTITADYGINVSSINITGNGVGGSGELLKIAGSTMVVLNNGNVGMGTTGPASPLHIYSNKGNLLNLEALPTTQSILSFITMGDGTKNLGSPQTKGWVIAARGDQYYISEHRNDLAFAYWDGTDWINKISIDSLTGNIGIGIYEPTFNLDVRKTGNKVLRLGNAGGNDLTFDIAAGAGLANIVAGAEWDGSNYRYTGTRGASRLTLHDGTIYLRVGGTSGTQGSRVTWTEGITINSSGNVGIGTVSPSQRLDVSGGDINIESGYGIRVGGTAQSGYVLRGDGSRFVPGQVSGSDVVGAALTKTDDTNVTLTLGGNPDTALLRDVSLTLGWQGQLGLGRGGTGADLSAVGAQGGLVYKAGASSFTVTNALSGMLKGNSSGAPTAVTGTAGRITYWSNNTTIGTSEISRDSANSFTFINATVTVQGNKFSVGGSTFVVDSGKVGIGTTSPIEKLHIEGGKIRIVDGTQGAGKVLTSDANGVASWQTFSAPGDNLGNHIATMTIVANYGINVSSINITGNGISGSGELLKIAGSTMVVLNNGNIGIGTTAPASPLHLYKPDKWNLLNLDARGTGSSDHAQMSFITLGDGTKNLGNNATKGWAVLARGNAYNVTHQQNDLMFYYWDGVSWKQVMSLDSITGNIGIGTDNPNSSVRLDIKGIGNSGNTYSIGLRNSSDIYTFGVRDDGAILVGGNRTYIGGFDGSGNHWIGINGGSESSNLFMAFVNTGGDTVADAVQISPRGNLGIYVNSSGNVGVGTNNPGSYKLYVNGNSYFSGTINLNLSDTTYGSYVMYWNGRLYYYYSYGWCPTFYSFDGERYKPEGGIIHGQAGKFFDRLHAKVLNFMPKSGRIKAKIKVEEPETSYIDYISIVIEDKYPSGEIKKYELKPKWASKDLDKLREIDSSYSINTYGDEIEIDFGEINEAEQSVERIVKVISKGYYDPSYKELQKEEWREIRKGIAKELTDLDSDGNLNIFRPVIIRNIDEFGYNSPQNLFSVNGPVWFKGSDKTLGLRVNDGGKVGVNLLDPDYELKVNGDIWINFNQWTLSDERLIKDIEPIGNVIDKIKKIQGVRYRFNDDLEKDSQTPKSKQIGIIAQNLEKIFPELVVSDTKGFKAISYEKLVPVLIEAIKEQQIEIDKLKRELEFVKGLN